MEKLIYVILGFGVKSTTPGSLICPEMIKQFQLAG